MKTKKRAAFGRLFFWTALTGEGKAMTDKQQPKYGRIVLKISGEALGVPGQVGLDVAAIDRLAASIVDAAATGVEIAIVVGGGNLMRGSTIARPVHEATGHYMGMLATVINGLALQDTIEAKGVPTRVMSAINIAQVCEPYIRRRCIRHLEKKRVVVLVSGTGNPFVTTDTCAALRALEIGADALLKATKVDGVYTEDPKKNPAAKRYDKLTYDQALDQRLGVMDISAFDLCQQKKVPIMVFNVFAEGHLLRAVRGEPVGTLISA
jgi:uridylate kinase